MGDARKAQSDFFIRKRSMEHVNKESDNGDNRHQQNNKRTKEQLEVPAITIEKTQQSADNGNEEVTRTPPTNIKEQSPEDALNGNYKAIKHERLVNKIDRYTSHNEFIRKCVESDIIPNSYKVILEPEHRKPR